MSEFSDLIAAHHVRVMDAALRRADSANAEFAAGSAALTHMAEHCGRFAPKVPQPFDDESTFAPTGCDHPELHSIADRHCQRAMRAYHRDRTTTNANAFAAAYKYLAGDC